MTKGSDALQSCVFSPLGFGLPVDFVDRDTRGQNLGGGNRIEDPVLPRLLRPAAEPFNPAVTIDGDHCSRDP